MMKKLVIAEKKSVAEDICKALGIKGKEAGYFEGDSYVISWAIGHLLELMDPEDIDKKYKAWLLKDLPILPGEFDLKVISRTRDQFSVLKKLLKRKDVDGVVNACDAGREGELIFRTIVDKEKSRLPVQRLWLSSMTKDAIRRGFEEELRDGAEFEGLADAARSRSESDWLIGINGTRAVTKRLQSRFNRTVFSVGRVQTPTLGMLVDRELEILTHVPRPYWKFEGEFDAGDHVYKGTLQLSEGDRENHEKIFDAKKAREIAEALSAFRGTAKASETRKKSLQKPYPLYDLTSLQRDAANRFGMSAMRTLSAAQRLYEREKVLTYPRTDSRHLPEDYKPIVDDVLKSLSRHGSYGPHAKRVLNKVSAGDKRIFDNKKISDHFAIIPTGEMPKKQLEGDDARIFDLVVKRLLAIFHPPAEYEVVDRITDVKDCQFRSRGRFLRVPGWVEVYGKEDEEEALPPLKSPEVKLSGYSEEELQTKPPSRIGEARLLSLMESAGKELKDEELYEAMEGKGIGTPATRADIIENLIQKEYVVRTGSALKATAKAIRLMDVLRRVQVRRLSSVELTAEMEARLKDVERGQVTRKDFMKEIEEYVTEVISQVKDFDYDQIYADSAVVGSCPLCSADIRENLWGYACEKSSGEEPSCTFRMMKEYSGRYMHPQRIQDFLSQRESGEEKFLFLDGKEFTGKLVLGKDCKVEVLQKQEDGSFISTRTKTVKELQEEEEFLSEEKISSEYMDQEGTFRVSSQAFYFEVPKFPKALGKKPPKAVEPFVGRLPNEVCQRPITQEEAKEFFLKGKTSLLRAFISKRGKPFNAFLYVKSNGKYGFEFEPRARKGTKGAGETSAEEKAAEA